MTMLPLANVFRQAQQYHKAGQLQQAEGLYRQILQTHPQHVDALHAMGLVAFQVGQYPLALDFIKQALSLHPTNPIIHNNLGTVLQKQGIFPEAAKHYQQAIQFQPTYAEAHYNLGNLLKAQNRWDDAIVAYQKAISLKPSYRDAHNNVGNIFFEQKHHQLAIHHYQKVVALEPSWVEGHYNLANALRDNKALEGAIAHYQTVIDLDPKYVDAYNNLGNVFETQGELEKAILCYQKGLVFAPQHAVLHNNWGSVLWEQGDHQAALGHFQKAIALEPNLADAHKNRGMVLLAMGDYLNGFPEYEWRLKTKSLPDYYRVKPQWQGEPISGKVLFIPTEQGAGDNIQFVRYLPYLRPYGCYVILACKSSLIRLFTKLPGVDELIVEGKAPAHFDYILPLASLAYVFETTFQRVPTPVPYLPKHSLPFPFIPKAHFKVGLVWTSHTPIGKKKSCSLTKLESLFQIPKIAFYCLQLDLTEQEKTIMEHYDTVFDLSPQIKDFTDTVAIIEQLDLLISIDTACLHLAGALGKPAWGLLPYAADWRWGIKGKTTPWYSSLQLFRQSQRGNWSTPLLEIQLALEQWGKEKELSGEPKNVVHGGD